ncbi:MAG: sigma-54-dependent transcriptional regulator [Candidatus Zhuqueibacterota bacterium]
MPEILIVEDNATMREAMVAIVERMGYSCDQAENGRVALERLAANAYEFVVSDYKMEGKNGLEILNHIKGTTPATEVLIITAYGTIELAVDVMKAGAADFITKPFSHDEFRMKVERIFQRIQERKELSRISDENAYLRQELDEQFNYGDIIGQSDAMRKVYQTIDKVAQTDSSVLIYGESGTGKELVARAIHKASPRKNKPFVRVNCGALAETLLESELFGHERGAFSGAIKRKKGRFELADGGSIFLDEIGDISANMQLKLLRVLQEKEFERVGSEETIQVDVRILAATNKNLSDLVQQGTFREDLYYRLHIIPIYLPALRERTSDIPILIDFFLARFRSEFKRQHISISRDAVEKLVSYRWPGNVRELENVIERAFVLCDGDAIRSSDLPILTSEESHKLPADLLDRFQLNLNDTLYAVEKHLLERAMQQSDGNKSQAAKILGIKTNLLYYKLEKFGMI